MKNDVKFYRSLIEILRERNVYDHKTWSYGIFHNIPNVVSEYFNSPSTTLKFRSYFKYINTDLLQISDNTLHEFHPLVNQRAHLL